MSAFARRADGVPRSSDDPEGARLHAGYCAGFFSDLDSIKLEIVHISQQAHCHRVARGGSLTAGLTGSAAPRHSGRRSRRTLVPNSAWASLDAGAWTPPRPAESVARSCCDGAAEANHVRASDRTGGTGRLVVVRPPPDSAAHHAEQRENEAYQQQDDADRPQDCELGDEADD